MPRKKTSENTSEKNETSTPEFLEGIELAELTPADLRSHFMRGMDALIEMIENTTVNPHDRLEAAKILDIYYTTVSIKDGMMESVNKQTNIQRSALDEVKRHRRKGDWQADED